MFGNLSLVHCVNWSELKEAVREILRIISPFYVSGGRG